MSRKQQLYLAVLFIPLIIGIIGFTILYNSPYTGLNFEQKGDKWYIASVDTGSPASSVPNLLGKEVVSIENRIIEYKDISTEMDKISDRAEFFHMLSSKKYFSNTIKIGKPFEILLKDSGSQISIKITPTTTPLLTILGKIWGLLLISLSFLIITAIIILRSGDQRGLIMIPLASFTSLFYISSNILIHSAPGFNSSVFIAMDIITAICIDYAIISLWHFCIVFPRVSVFGKNKLLVTIAYILPLVIFVLTYFRIYFPLYNIFASIFMLWGTGTLLYNYFTIDSPIEKAQARWVVWGLTIFILLEMVFYFLPLMVMQKFLLPQNILLLFAVLIPLGMAFAIMRYKLMDIDTLFDNTLIYTITIGLLAMLDILVIYVLVWFKVLQVLDIMTLIISIWLIIFLYLPVRDFITGRIKKILKRDVYDPNLVSLELSRKLLLAVNIKDAFVETIDVIVQSLHPKGSAAYILTNNGAPVLLGGGQGYGYVFSHTSEEPTLLYQMCNEKDLPYDYSGGVYIPVKTGNNNMFGYILLQNKISQRLYDKEDLKLLNTVSNQLAMAIEAINTREELRQKDIDIMTEKNRIAREIHDGIGTNLVQLKLLMNMIDKDASIKEKLKHLIDEGIIEMRELIWVAEKDSVKLSELISYMESRLAQIQGVIPINIKAVINNDALLSATLKLNIIRLVQESVTNILKHANATNILLEFTKDDDILTMKITDDGKGFDINVDPSGNGLRNMRKRCEEIGAKLMLDSVPGIGTSIQIEINTKNQT